jgi:FMN reductase
MNTPRILLLAGSPSRPSRSQRLLEHAGQLLLQRGHRHYVLNVRDLPAQALLHADFGNAELVAARVQVEQADAIVIATPIYKASCSGILKAFLDLLPQSGLKEKLVLPLATGGSAAHMLALDYGLRPVLAALGATHVLPGVYATDAQVRVLDDGPLELDSDIERRLRQGVDLLCENLLLQPALANSAAPAPAGSPRCRCLRLTAD